MPNKSYRTRTYPWLERSGDVVIPFASDEKYHWWKGGQSASKTQKALLERRKKAKPRDDVAEQDKDSVK